MMIEHDWKSNSFSTKMNESKTNSVKNRFWYPFCPDYTLLNHDRSVNTFIYVMMIRKNTWWQKHERSNQFGSKTLTRNVSFAQFELVFSMAFILYKEIHAKKNWKMARPNRTGVCSCALSTTPRTFVYLSTPVPGLIFSGYPSPRRETKLN